MAAKKEQSTTSTETDFARTKIDDTDEDISFEKRLESFAHSFHLTDLMYCSKQRREKILEKLQRGQEEEKRSLMERNRDDNFISFLLFLLGDRDNAIKTNLKVRHRDPTNIVARANRVRFLLKQDKRSAESELIELENLKGDVDRMRAVAEAELAYCYARISPASYLKSVKLYRKVNEKYPEEYEWKFDEGLTLRRCLSDQGYSFQSSIDVVKYAVRCYELLQDVGSKAPEPLNAMAYAELGELAKLLELRWTPFEDQILVNEIKQQTGLLSRQEYFQKALDLGKEVPFVLASCGKHFLNTKQLDTAEKLLEESVRLLPTGNALHHLGKVLLKKAKWSNNRRTFQRAIKNLKQALEITHGKNIDAAFQLVSAYISDRHYKDAELVLRDVIEGTESNTNPFYKVFALKELCNISREKSGNWRLSREEQTRLEKEEMNYKILAIEASATEVLYTYRTHFRTVTDLVTQTKGPRGVEIPWQVKDLYRMISQFTPSLPIYEKIQKRNVGRENWIGITEEYLNGEEYENARLCVSLLMGTQQADDIPSSLVNRVYLKTAEQILSRGESPDKAWSCFRRMFTFYYKTKKEDEINGADIMILHDKDDWETSQISNKIQEILEDYTGLKVTRNDELSFDAVDEISFYEQLMPLIRCIVVVVNSYTPNTQWKQIIDLAIATATKNEKMVIVCLKSGETHRVTELNGFKTGKTPPDDADDKAAVDWLLKTFPLFVNADVSL